MSGSFNTAQVCLNGHVVTSMFNNSNFSAEYCEECGEHTITKCQNCGENIRGKYEIPQVIDFTNEYHKPSFCFNCGNPFPWIERAKIAANELIQYTENLSTEEKADFIESLNKLLSKSTNSTLAEIKVKKYLDKAGIVVANGIKNIIIDLISESIKKSIFG